MESARDSCPDASQASGAPCLSVAAQGWLRPLVSSDPRVSSGSRGDSPTSGETIPASPPSGQPPEASHLPHVPTLRHHSSLGIGLKRTPEESVAGPAIRPTGSLVASPVRAACPALNASGGAQASWHTRAHGERLAAQGRSAHFPKCYAHGQTSVRGALYGRIWITLRCLGEHRQRPQEGRIPT